MNKRLYEVSINLSSTPNYSVKIESSEVLQETNKMYKLKNSLGSKIQINKKELGLIQEDIFKLNHKKIFLKVLLDDESLIRDSIEKLKSRVKEEYDKINEEFNKLTDALYSEIKIYTYDNSDDDYKVKISQEIL